ncbi:hypothetical protein N480_19380 [Pseudoalteromonas luteoviolacea S2607]|uniref:DUF6334 family protein n=1 Tax=Pseudoalteromonas luteoviolacea TaxID=43657 RepID=UPI0007B0411A|nr:DUF6334 family protein [Pseudoalteromonas luteoviolacea]KZN35208.1 hypothetical protein N480_19380 [Pseudoalteromonas luteoviolacea S2607]
MNLVDIVFDSGKLNKVVPYSSGERAFDGLLIGFDAISFFLKVEADTDEVVLLESIPVNFAPLVSTLALDDCLGKRLMWAWSMMNQQGYLDGIKFEFDNAAAFEVVVLASEFKLYRVSEI